MTGFLGIYHEGWTLCGKPYRVPLSLDPSALANFDPLNTHGLGAGFFRLIFHRSGFHPLSLPVRVLGCSLFIIIGIIYDKITHRHVHPVYWAGLIVMLIVEVSLLPQVNGEMVTWINEGLAPIGEYLRDFYPTKPTGKM